MSTETTPVGGKIVTYLLAAGVGGVLIAGIYQWKDERQQGVATSSTQPVPSLAPSPSALPSPVAAPAEPAAPSTEEAPADAPSAANDRPASDIDQIVQAGLRAIPNQAGANVRVERIIGGTYAKANDRGNALYLIKSDGGWSMVASGNVTANDLRAKGFSESAIRAFGP